MKKIYTLVAAALLSGAVFGQQIQKRYTFGSDLNNEVRAKKLSHLSNGAIAKTSALRSGYIDYS